MPFVFLNSLREAGDKAETADLLPRVRRPELTRMTWQMGDTGDRLL